MKALFSTSVSTVPPSSETHTFPAFCFTSRGVYESCVLQQGGVREGLSEVWGYSTAVVVVVV